MKNKLQKIFQIFAANNPHPKTELKYNNEYQLLVAVILSAQATDVGVNKATDKFFDQILTPKQMLGLGENNLIEYIKSINFYKNKARNVIKMTEVLINEYNSIVPHKFDQLILLPGVGRKTANVILNCLFGHDTIAVDTHVFRVSKRIGLARGTTPEEVENELIKIVPKKYRQHAHHWLILHGRYICKARKPNCDICLIREYCNYYQNEKTN
ncbi:MAG: endonuclease III [Sphingobacteriia bacterium]|nr:endonuclease III [Sphingobacteriia bacterium]